MKYLSKASKKFAHWYSSLSGGWKILGCGGVIVVGVALGAAIGWGIGALCTVITELATLEATVVAAGEIAVEMLTAAEMGAIIGGTTGLIPGGYTLYKLNL